MKYLMIISALLGLSASLPAVNLKPFGISVIESFNSDHEAFAVTIPLGGKKGETKIKVLTWNTWARGSRGWF